MTNIAEIPIPESWYVYVGCCYSYPQPHPESSSYRVWFQRKANREFHPWPEILVVLKGVCPFGWRDTVWRLHPGAILLIAPGESHAYLYPAEYSPDNHLWIAVRDGFWVATLHGNGVLRTKRFSTHEGVFPLLQESWYSLNNPSSPYEDSDEHPGERVDRQLERLRFHHLAVAGILQILKEYMQPFRETDRTDAVIEWAVEFIDSHPHLKLTLTELARMAGYSKYHFHRLFRDRTGKTPMQYLTERKVAFANEMLKSGYSCKAAAYELGFSDPSAFSRWYKNLTGGITPGRIGGD